MDVTGPNLSDDQLNELLELAKRATPRPWYVRELDDQNAASFVAISNVPGTGEHDRWPDFYHGEIVAATLVQNPRYVDIADEKWDENAAFIVAAANVLPALIGEVLELRKQMAARAAAANGASQPA